jgi:hypothetical protein
MDQPPSFRNKGKGDVVYKIVCTDCNATYVGETGRAFGERLTEHQKTSGTNITAVGHHCAYNNHKVTFEDCSVLDQAGGSKKPCTSGRSTQT